MEHETPRQFPKTDWIILAEVCQEKGVDMKKLVWPELWKDQVSVTERRSVIREGSKRGITVSSWTALTPFTRQGIYDILRNGSTPSAEPRADITNDPRRTDGA